MDRQLRDWKEGTFSIPYPASDCETSFIDLFLSLGAPHTIENGVLILSTVHAVRLAAFLHHSQAELKARQLRPLRVRDEKLVKLFLTNRPESDIQQTEAFETKFVEENRF